MRLSTCSLIVWATVLLTAFATSIPYGDAVTFLDVTVFTDKALYLPYEDLTIFGELTFNKEPVQDSGLVGLQVDDPVHPIFIRTLAVGPYLIDPIVEVLSAMSCDFYINPKGSFMRGEEAYFYVVVRNNDVISSRSVLVTALAFDALNVPLGPLFACKLTVDPASTVGVRFGPMVIPTWSAAGEAKAYANAFSDWPGYGGCPYCPEKAASFHVIGLELEDHETSSTCDVDVSSHSYKLTVRLHPESRAGPGGGYRVHASASYRWWKAYSTRVFSVPPGPYKPKASFEHAPRVAWIGCQMIFDASTSVPVGEGDKITKYVWDFGDGSPPVSATTPRVYKAYQTNGTFTVTLNVTDGEGMWGVTSKEVTVLTEKRDVAVTRIESLTEIYVNWIVNVTVTVRNLGGPKPETFVLRLLCNGTVIGTYEVVDLKPWPEGVLTLTFTWNTSELTPYVVYVLEAEVEPLEGEDNVANNVRTLTIDKVKALGDITGDRKVDIYDVVLVAAAYDARPGDARWNVQMDLIRDNKIDIYDVVIVTFRYGMTY